MCTLHIVAKCDEFNPDVLVLRGHVFSSSSRRSIGYAYGCLVAGIVCFSYSTCMPFANKLCSWIQDLTGTIVWNLKINYYYYFDHLGLRPADYALPENISSSLNPNPNWGCS